MVKEGVMELVCKGDGYALYRSRKRTVYEEKEIEKALVPEGWEKVWSGGAYPELLVYDPEKYYSVWLSARERIKYKSGDLYTTECPVLEISATPHGSFKIIRHQLILLLPKKGADSQKFGQR